MIDWSITEFRWHDGTILYSANCMRCEWSRPINPEDPRDAVRTHWDTAHHPLVPRD